MALEGVSSVMGKDDFLHLLVTQLQHQDPLNPMDSTQFTAQLAQFTSLEELNNVNDNLSYLLLYQASINNSQAVGFIGKSLTALGDSINLADGVAEDIRFDLDGDSSMTSVTIYDSDGNLVRVLEGGAMGAGTQTMQWDGLNSQGEPMPNGLYRFEVTASDANGDTVNVTTLVSGRVTGVTFKDNVTYLLLDSREIPMGNVIEVTES
ncbi:MAG: flagellar hook capping FlgD N-terminal domain-containing protein [Desulfatiglans sp.]|jgi:flagellar basal-body rod modification protein FlgD|nr:flagellar hook capping FlgD N-terminal domain-containing protein [Thermodesulfobacteriota bacterium]MEE4354465.1 flagellar hook capping FlgD N-terminal domain-containing protein [Desulfatiglans sp.]